MIKVEQLIKELEELKKAMSVNGAPSADIVRPDAGFGKVTVKSEKEPKPFGSVIDKTVTPKPPTNPKKPFGAVIQKEECMKFGENGQWSIEKLSDHKK